MLSFRISAVLLVATAFQLEAGEFAVLSTGFRLHAERHEVVGSHVRLETKDGVIQIAANQISSFEPEEFIPPPPPTSAPAQPAPIAVVTSPKELLDQAAYRQGIPKAIVQSVAKIESGYRVDAVSPKGALGLMQLMPATAAALSADPRNPEQNADAGARYLRELLLKYKDQRDQVRMALAAYNAGPAAVDRYHGIPPYRETILYVDKVLRQYHKLQP